MLFKSSLRVFVAFIALASLCACGGKKEGADKATSSAQAKSEDDTKDFLTEDIVKRVMGLEPSVKFEEDQSWAHLKKLQEYNERSQKALKEGKQLNEPYPEKPPRPTYCIERIMRGAIKFSYPKPNAEEIRKKNQERAMEMAMGMLGNAAKGQKESERKAGKAMTGMLTALPESENVEIAFGSYNRISKQQFESASQFLRNGGNLASKESIEERIEAARKEGKDEATLKTMRNMLEGGNKINGDTTMEDVSGVGELATWSAKRRELRVFLKDHYFAINMDYKDAENKQKAIEIAQEVIKKM